MAVVGGSQYEPKSLYETSTACVADNFERHRSDLIFLPDSVLFDVYYKVL